MTDPLTRVVAADGTGDFTSIQAAVDAVPDGPHPPVTLRLRAGVYRERVIVNKDDLRIVGDSREDTRIVYGGCAKDQNPDGSERGTFLSYTLLVTGNRVTFQNLTVQNDAGDGREVGQAMAVYAAGDSGVWRGCNILACQDTLFCGPTMPKVALDALPRVVPDGVQSAGDHPAPMNRQYFEDCFIRGDVDFIFGPYRCWFERCTLFMNAPGGWYTAANTPQEARYGLVFHRCRLTGECEDGEGFLGRPWRPYARTLFLRCEMDACVSPQGFADWLGGAPVTDRCGEYGTVGARADQSTRHPRQKRLTREEADAISAREVLGDDAFWLAQI